MYSSLDSRFAAADLAPTGEQRDVLEAYLMIAQDRGWLDRIREAMHGGLTAEAAVRRVQDDMRARMRQISDLYIRERLHDLDDLRNRLLQHPAAGETNGVQSPQMPPDPILFARSRGTAVLPAYTPQHVHSVFPAQGTPTAHLAAVA